MSSRRGARTGTVDPFTLLERDGFFYGRGTEDVKDGAAIMTANVIQFIRKATVPIAT